ncbi:MAG: hypothetical protein JNK77_18520 [Saprospiraceae bacterium]|nr:hypothetical protein [Saprospiraceae bacterium]
MANFRISYWAAEESAAGFLGRQLQQQGLSWRPYELGTVLDCDIFILLSPVWCNNHFISCDKTWKKYLELNYPEVRFISAGFDQIAQENYIDLLDLPKNWAFFFLNARISRDAFDVIDTGGLDMSNKLRAFFEGHGNDSILQIFSPIYMALRIVRDEINKGKNTYQKLYTEVISQIQLTDNWRIFLYRFSNYYSFFSCLPFFSLFEMIKTHTEIIRPYFDEGCKEELLFTQLGVMEHISEIKRYLDEAESYVR